MPETHVDDMAVARWPVDNPFRHRGCRSARAVHEEPCVDAGDWCAEDWLWSAFPVSAAAVMGGQQRVDGVARQTATGPLAGQGSHQLRSGANI